MKNTRVFSYSVLHPPISSRLVSRHKSHKSIQLFQFNSELKTAKMEVQLEKLTLNTKSKEEGKIGRHCAFCLTRLDAKDVKNCGKCLRRVYCGKECQTKDWKSTKSNGQGADETSEGQHQGQGHKDWCGVGACEEDLDWVVKKGGKGVIAKRLILKGERILVGKPSQLGERTGTPHPDSLFNHSCAANSVLNNAMDYKVVIVTAEKDIEEGSEITLDYIGFREYFTPVGVVEGGSFSFIPINSFEACRKVLKTKYGIICPDDCLCYNKEIEKLIIKRKEVIEELFVQLETKDAEAIKVGGLNIVQILQDLIAEYDLVGGGSLGKAQMICILMTALARPSFKKYSHLLPKYKTEADVILKSIFHPKSPNCNADGWRRNSFARV